MRLTLHGYGLIERSGLPHIVAKLNVEESIVELLYLFFNLIKDSLS